MHHLLFQRNLATTILFMTATENIGLELIFYLELLELDT